MRIVLMMVLLICVTSQAQRPKGIPGNAKCTYIYLCPDNMVFDTPVPTAYYECVGPMYGDLSHDRWVYSVPNDKGAKKHCKAIDDEYQRGIREQCEHPLDYMDSTSALNMCGVIKGGIGPEGQQRIARLKAAEERQQAKAAEHQRQRDSIINYRKAKQERMNRSLDSLRSGKDPGRIIYE